MLNTDSFEMIKLYADLILCNVFFIKIPTDITTERWKFVFYNQYFKFQQLQVVITIPR